MQDKNPGTTDAIEEFKQCAVDVYPDSCKHKLPADIMSAFSGGQIGDRLAKNIFDIFYQGITGNNIGNRSEEMFGKYVYE